MPVYPEFASLTSTWTCPSWAEISRGKLLHIAAGCSCLTRPCFPAYNNLQSLLQDYVVSLSHDQSGFSRSNLGSLFGELLQLPADA